jgi:replicative DNA helicase
MTDRLPPHSEEAEKGYIGCALSAPYDVLANTPVQAEVFYDHRHTAIYQLLAGMVDKQQPVDLITVSQALRDAKQLDLVGGVGYISTLLDATPSSANASYYATILQEKFYLRRKLAYHVEQMRLVYDFQGDLPSFMAQDKTAFEVVEQTAILKQERQTIGAKDFVDLTLQDLERRQQLQGKLTGLHTGVRKLDNLTGGYQPGDFVIIGARPNDGKSAFAMFSTDTQLFAHNEAVGIITLEMAPAALGRRLCALRTGIDIADLKSGVLSEGQVKQIANWAGPLSRKRIFIEDARDGLTGRQARSIIQRGSRQHGIKLWIIEGFIQDMRADSKRNSRTEELQEICSNLKAAAEYKEANSVVMALAQLNREKEKEKGRLPRMADLADSAGMERKADIILLLHRDYKEDIQGQQAAIVVAKQRDGGREIIPMHFDAPRAKWCEVSPVTDVAA